MSKCEGLSETAVGDTATTSLAKSRIAFDPTKLLGIKASTPMVVTICDGVATQVIAHYDALPGQVGVNAGGGAITITRETDWRATTLQAPRERWSAGVIAGHPAALLAPVIDTVGTTAVLVLDGDGSAITTIHGAGVTLKFVVGLAEEIYR